MLSFKPDGWTDEMWQIHREDVSSRVRAGEQKCPECGWSLSVALAGGPYHREFARIACRLADPCVYVDVARATPKEQP